MTTVVVDEVDYRGALKALKQGTLGNLMGFAEGIKELGYLEAKMLI